LVTGSLPGTLEDNVGDLLGFSVADDGVALPELVEGDTCGQDVLVQTCIRFTCYITWMGINLSSVNFP
jgi:hypothetical protein